MRFVTMKIYRKWLTIIAIPLAFEIVFVSGLMFVINRWESEVVDQVKSHKVKEIVQKLVVVFDDAIFSMAEYAMNQNPILIEDLKENNELGEQLIDELMQACDTNDFKQNKSVQDLTDYKSDYRAMLGGIKQWVEPGSHKSTPTSEQIMICLALKQRMTQASLALKDLFTYRKALDEDIKENEAFWRLFLRIWVLIGIACNIGITVLLTHLFGRDITRRIEELKKNIMRLVMGQDIQPSQYKNTDEIGQFNEVFYEVASTLQNSFDREKANFDNAADAVCALDQGGRITRVNKAFQATLGGQTSDILHSYFVEHLDPELRADFPNLLKQVQQEGGKRHEYEALMVTSSDVKRDFLWSVIWEGSQKVFMCVGHDITDYRRLERAKQDFVAMLSHDLRSPLNSIGATFELVRSGAFGEINKKLSANLERAQDSVKRLIQLISELLDLEKLEAGEMDLRISQVSVRRVVDIAVSTLEATAESTGIKIKSTPSELKFFADEDRLVRVIVNLVSNAIKYSKAGDEVLIEVDEIEDGKALEFRVIDLGNGIPQEHLDKVFERYKQVSRYDHSVKQGSGLGLAICRAIVKAHNGTIGVESTVGKGSIFWFRIPRIIHE
ncbi:MAG: PAS domain-containing protein [Candidatus Obscuribacterales bacterium]|nr:PAS domain-containing protein [Candidatus Obscuribacterales bacterium]